MPLRLDHLDPEIRGHVERGTRSLIDEFDFARWHKSREG